MSDTRPNVLLICTDHWPGSLLGCAGHPAVLTPTLDQLARNGVRFHNAYSECPVCVPARRTLMTGLSPYSHGMLRNGARAMPDVPTLAGTFVDHGYQAYAVGKLHVFPQRQRIGFDDVLLDEEGRILQAGMIDDYEMFLADHGHAGERFAGGMCNNEYMWRPWHLEERLHVTNWAAAQMARMIQRRDPLRPSFWYLSFSHPHPPLAPLQAYLDVYRDIQPPEPFVGDWVGADSVPWKVREYLTTRRMADSPIAHIRRAFYAACTHIDHQLRVVIGTLREEGLLDNTIVCFTSDHGDMLGNHRMWAKQHMYEDSNRVPMLLMGTRDQMLHGPVGYDRTDERLVGLGDVMPTLLTLAGIDDVPGHCEGLSMVDEARRDHLFGCFGLGAHASRMVRDRRYKLIYYPAGNHRQLFDMIDDPHELHDLAQADGHADHLERLSAVLIKELNDQDHQAWVRDDWLVGLAEPAEAPIGPNRNFSGQRGSHYPPPTR